jgi:hypothetical protein
MWARVEASGKVMGRTALTERCHHSLVGWLMRRVLLMTRTPTRGAEEDGV